MTITRSLESAIAEIDGVRFTIDLRSPHSLAIALDFNEVQPRWFGAPPARSAALASGSFTGRVKSGASCNCSTVTLTPHLDGTHTECAGHLTLEKMDVTPAPAERTDESTLPAPRAGDLLITAAALKRAWPAKLPFTPQALIVRTLPNVTLKRTRDYRAEPGAFLSLPSASLLVAQGIEHLVLDVPSADWAEDGGELSAHRAFFGLPAGSVALAAACRPQCTITELAYIDDAVDDGVWLLSLQIPAFGGDAVPSRPLLFPVYAA